MPDYAYRDVMVESFAPRETSARHGPVHVRPLAGQIYSVDLYVSCSKRLKDTERHPLGTVFKVSAALTDRGGAGEYLYVNPRDVENVPKPKAVKAFIAGLQRGFR